VLFLLDTAAFVAVIIAWFAILFTGRWSRSSTAAPGRCIEHDLARRCFGEVGGPDEHRLRWHGRYHAQVGGGDEDRAWRRKHVTIKPGVRGVRAASEEHLT
jgi:hypothetical protein